MAKTRHRRYDYMPDEARLDPFLIGYRAAENGIRRRLNPFRSSPENEHMMEKKSLWYAGWDQWHADQDEEAKTNTTRYRLVSQ